MGGGNDLDGNFARDLDGALAGGFADFADDFAADFFAACARLEAVFGRRRLSAKGTRQLPARSERYSHGSSFTASRTIPIRRFHSLLMIRQFFSSTIDLRVIRYRSGMHSSP